MIRVAGIFACWLGLLLSSAVWAQQIAPQTLSFEEARTSLEQTSDALAAADANVRGKLALSDASKSLRLPEISVDVRRMEFQKSLSLPLGSLAPVAAAFDIPSPLEFRERDWRTRPILTTVLPLYSGGQIPAAQSAAAAAVRQATAERDQASQAQVLQLVQLYFGQQLARQALAVRRDVRDGLQRHVDNTDKLEQEGFATKAQRLQAAVARDQAEREYQRAINDLDTISASLSKLLRSDRPIATSTPLFVISTTPGPLETFLQSALSYHPQIRRLKALSQQASEGVKVQKAKLKPQLYAFGQYDLHRDDALITDSDWAFGIGLKYTFLSGRNRNREIAAALEQQFQTEAGLREAHNQITIGVGKTYNDLESARQQFLLLDSSIELARESLRLQELSFREGQVTSLDVIDARLQLGGALVERAQAAYEYDVTLARLLEMSGQLNNYQDYFRQADKVLKQ
ncbi:MAG: TolC family protein [Proteobacteria bacterium]|nr:MAG: TolC family protein [Pseudomonadota bacterium]